MEGTVEAVALLEALEVEEVVEVEDMERRMEERSLRPPFMARVPRSGTSELSEAKGRKEKIEGEEKKGRGKEGRREGRKGLVSFEFLERASSNKKEGERGWTYGIPCSLLNFSL